MRRSRKSCGARVLGMAACAAGVCALASRPAAAQQPVQLDDEITFQSPQRWAFELRFGPYAPEIDSEFGGKAAPHESYFGDERRLMTQVELDYQFWHAFGSLALGVSTGYFRETAHPYVEPSPGSTPTDRSKADSTHLTLVPFGVGLVYRMDMAQRRWGIPLIPYGKLGLNYTIWSADDPDGEVATATAPGSSDKRRGRGGTLGWQVAGGLSLQLDFIDPDAARRLDTEVGINSTHLFIEWTRIELPAFGGEKKLHVGDTTWFAGLLFEM